MSMAGNSRDLGSASIQALWISVLRRWVDILEVAATRKLLQQRRARPRRWRAYGSILLHQQLSRCAVQKSGLIAMP